MHWKFELRSSLYKLSHPFSLIALLLTWCIHMAHDLQLVNQYWYIITNQSLVGISVYLMLDRSMRFPVYTVPCIPHCSIIKNRFIAWKSPCALPIHLLSPLSGSLITTYHLLPLYFFLKYYKVGLVCDYFGFPIFMSSCGVIFFCFSWLKSILLLQRAKVDCYLLKDNLTASEFWNKESANICLCVFTWA